MTSTRIPTNAPFLFRYPRPPLVFDEPPPPYTYASTSIPPLFAYSTQVPRAQPAHVYAQCPIRKNCPQCKKYEERSAQELRDYLVTSWNALTVFKVAHFFLVLFGLVFITQLLSLVQLLALGKTLVHHILSAIQDAFLITLVHPMIDLSSWSWHQPVALWNDFCVAITFIPVFFRIVARSIGIYLTIFLLRRWWSNKESTTVQRRTTQETVRYGLEPTGRSVDVSVDYPFEQHRIQ